MTVATVTVLSAARRALRHTTAHVPHVAVIAPYREFATRLTLRATRMALSGRLVSAANAPWPRTLRRGITVVAEETPNPESLMFYPGERNVLGEGIKTIKFSNKYDTADSPLASAIFKVKGVAEIMLAARHITVTKTPASNWPLVQPNVELVIGQFYAAGLHVVKEGVVERESNSTVFVPGSIEALIVEILEERVRPVVQQDGGDIEFDRFDSVDGTLYLKMHGACSGCPKSSVTLQSGIKSLMEHYIPEVKEIVHVDDNSSLPRPH